MFIVITGQLGVGKSTFLRKLGKILSYIYSVGGVITIGQEKREFIDMKTNEKCSFREEGDGNLGIQIGKFFISNKSLAFASKAIESATDADMIFIDEIGRLESKKEGLFDSISNLFSNIDEKEKMIILGVRKEVVSELFSLFSIENEKIWILKKYPSEKKLIEVTDFIIENYL